MNTRRAEVVEFAQQHWLSIRFLENFPNTDFRSFIEKEANRVCWAMRSRMLKIDHTTETKREEKIVDTIKVTTSWFQHFKEANGKRWWLRWFVKRYPVQYKEHQVQIVINVTNIESRMCPHVSIPEHSIHFEWLSRQK